MQRIGSILREMDFEPSWDPYRRCVHIYICTYVLGCVYLVKSSNYPCNVGETRIHVFVDERKKEYLCVFKEVDMNGSKFPQTFCLKELIKYYVMLVSVAFNVYV